MPNMMDLRRASEIRVASYKIAITRIPIPEGMTEVEFCTALIGLAESCAERMRREEWRNETTDVTDLED